jgi:hypothetical protein
VRLIPLSSLTQFAAVDLSSDLGNIGGPIVIPNCVQIVLKWTQQDGKGANVVTYGRVGGIPAPTVTQADQIFSALSTGAQYTALKALQSSTSAFTGVTLRSVHSKDQPIIASTGAAVSGTAVGATFPNEVALVITLRTALVGRANRGRMFIPNWTADSSAAGNVVLASSVTVLQNWANTLISAYAAGGYTMVIGQQERADYTSPKTGTHFPHRDATSVTVTQCTVRNNTWDTQRRRGLK